MGRDGGRVTTATVLAALVVAIPVRTTSIVLRAVDDGSLAKLTAQARRETEVRPKDPDALALYTQTLVWQQRLGIARLDRRPDNREARRLRDRLEAFPRKRTLDLVLAHIQFDHDFGLVVLDPGEGKYKEGWDTFKGTLPDGTVKYYRERTFDLIGPSDADAAKQRERVEQAIRMAPNDPEVLLLRASRALKSKPEVAAALLARAVAAGAEQIQPLSTRILAWQILKSPEEKAKLVVYLQRTQNDRVTRTALRGNPELAKLAGIKP